MIEKIISIESVDPVHIYGINNSNLERIKNFFPKIKIIARGNEVKVIGEKEEIVEFEKKLYTLIEHLNNYNKLTEKHIEHILHDRLDAIFESDNPTENVIIFGNNGKIIKARSYNQQKLVEASLKNDLVFSIGPAGTGKTYLAIAMAVRAFRNREVKRIILSRPAVEAEEKLGFLPGDLKDKLDPYLQPLYDSLHDMISPKKLADMMRDNLIQIAPLAYMRGRTLSNAFVILDEAQNATVNQIKMFLTRMGEQSKFIITGDITQIDLPKKRNSGLIHSLRILKEIDGIAIIEFGATDIVRHRLVKKVVDAYENDNLT